MEQTEGLASNDDNSSPIAWPPWFTIIESMDYETASSQLNGHLKELNLTPLDKDGRCIVRGPQGNRFMLELADDAGAVSLYAPLRKMEARDDKVKFYEAALTLNLMPDVTGGSAVAFDPRTQSLVLSQPLDVETLTTASLTAAMSAFALVCHLAGEVLSGTVHQGRAR